MSTAAADTAASNSSLDVIPLRLMVLSSFEQVPQRPGGPPFASASQGAAPTCAWVGNVSSQEEP